MKLIFGGWIGWVFTPTHNGVNLHTQSTAKFRRWLKSFKPQRGKFTQPARVRQTIKQIVSNPNGVNLHYAHTQKTSLIKSFKPQRGKFTPSVF